MIKVGYLLMLIGCSGLVVQFFFNKKLVAILLMAIGFGSYITIYSHETNVTIGILLLILAAVLVVIELIVPDFGLIGITGGLSLIAAFLFGQQDLVPPLIHFIVAVIVSVAIGFWLIKNGHPLQLSHHFVLDTALDKSRGFQSIKSIDNVIGLTGVTKTILRPTGKVYFEALNQTIDCLSDGPVIKAGVPVVVSRISSGTIIVTVLEEE